MNTDFNAVSELTKIRKFIFSDIKSACEYAPGLLEAYNTYWLEMENNFLNICDVNLFEQFIVDYLTIQDNGLIPDKKELMTIFCEYYTRATKYQSKEIVLRNIYRYSIYFLKISFGQIKDKEIKAKIAEINSLGAKDAYPFLMEVFEDYDYAHINKNMLLDILDTVIGFIHDRNSKEPSQMAVSFAGLSNEINKMMILKDYVPKFIVEETGKEEGSLTINKIVNTL